MIVQESRLDAAREYWEAWSAAEIGGELRQRESMRKHTYVGIGGPADLFYLPSSARGIARAVAMAVRFEIPWRVVGRGSNLLVRDGGLPGLTIKLGENFQGSRFGDHWVYCRSGATFANVGKKCVRRGWAGLEFCVGIPGSVGGAVRMNAGAYGHETKDVLAKVRYMDERGRLHTVPSSEIEFSYRKSSFRDGDTVLGALFRLRREMPDQEVLDRARRRSEVQPISERSFGSTYKNPRGHSAWKLIEESGFKGFRKGGVEVSMRHSNFMINRSGDALAADVEDILERIEVAVAERFGIQLEREVQIIGVPSEES